MAAPAFSVQGTKAPTSLQLSKLINEKLSVIALNQGQKAPDKAEALVTYVRLLETVKTLETTLKAEIKGFANAGASVDLNAVIESLNELMGVTKQITAETGRVIEF